MRYIRRMRPPLPIVLLSCVALAACGRSREHSRADVESCSASGTTALAITQCLRTEAGWPQAAAESAALARAGEIDSLEREIDAITRRSDSRYQSEVESCDKMFEDLKTCLITRYGWVEDRAAAADDSLWNSHSSEHNRQVRNCLGRRGVGTGACLQLHYKWSPRRALALDDSLRRANLR